MTKVALTTRLLVSVLEGSADYGNSTNDSMARNGQVLEFVVNPW